MVEMFEGAKQSLACTKLMGLSVLRPWTWAQDT